MAAPLTMCRLPALKSRRRLALFAVITLSGFLGVPGTVLAQQPDFSVALDRAKRTTIGVLEETQDQRTPDRPGPGRSGACGCARRTAPRSAGR